VPPPRSHTVRYAGVLGAESKWRVDPPLVSLTRPYEGLVLDLVRDRSYQLHVHKPLVDGVAIDPPDEILANKLTTIVGRAEERDLVEMLMLERTGLRVEDALAGRKGTVSADRPPACFAYALQSGAPIATR